MSNAAGIYIVTLKNDVPISANAHDPRVAGRAIAVTRANCKFGKARNLDARRKNYERTFRIENIRFFPIAEIEDIAGVERKVLARLRDFRVRGATGRKNEWLVGISPVEWPGEMGSGSVPHSRANSVALKLNPTPFPPLSRSARSPIILICRCLSKVAT
jgi:hypothetical protein